MGRGKGSHLPELPRPGAPLRWSSGSHAPLRRPLHAKGASALARCGGPHDAEVEAGANGRPRASRAAALDPGDYERTRSGVEVPEPTALPASWKEAPSLEQAAREQAHEGSGMSAFFKATAGRRHRNFRWHHKVTDTSPHKP